MKFSIGFDGTNVRLSTSFYPCYSKSVSLVFSYHFKYMLFPSTKSFHKIFPFDNILWGWFKLHALAINFDNITQLNNFYWICILTNLSSHYIFFLYPSCFKILRWSKRNNHLILKCLNFKFFCQLSMLICSSPQNRIDIKIYSLMSLFVIYSWIYLVIQTTLEVQLQKNCFR